MSQAGPPADRFPAASIAAALRATAARLAAAGIDSARLDARLLVGDAVERDVGWLIGHPEALLSNDQQSRLEVLARRREAREPMAYILGRKEFWSLDFQVTPNTLIPRPDTETLVECVLDARPDAGQAFRLLDLGTGSGCLLLSILHERPAATGLGIDASAGALEVAAANARALGLDVRASFLQSDWFSALPAGPDAVFDVIVANPPYVADAEMNVLAPEISGYEPVSALTAGADGLGAYRAILAGLGGRLRPGGLFVGEIGSRQGDPAMELARAHGLSDIEILPDAAGQARVLKARA